MQDRRGNPVGTASADALAHAETALWRMCSFFDAPLADIDAAIAADPGWMLPHVMRAGFLLTLTEPSLIADARAALEQADLLATQATERERAHWAAASRCAAGDWHGACAAWERLLLDHPRDLYALQWAHLFDFYRGDARNLRGRVARVLPEWPRDDPLRPYLLGMHAFGLEECNLYAQAEAVGREAVAGEAKVPWATHAVAHVMEMQGRFDEGRRWLHEQEATWAEGNGFAGHLWWHQALFHLEAMDLAGALALYDAHQGGAHAVLTLQRLDGAALLWRLRLLGADLARRWADLAQGWDLTPRDAGHSAFNDVHMLIALIGLGDAARAQALVAAVQRRAERSSDSNAPMAREVGLPLMRALLAFDDGDAAEAIRWLAPLRETAHRFGGSHAQRDLIDQTLLAACALPGGERALGRALLNERQLVRGATPQVDHWRGRLGLVQRSTG
ncbi:tetratricopeptide repeat protein [uncultured Piscinibacter sp.]|uniref:tetratricopeptide repeat protein n=1 Tax=uncultured Piscinibacter sp. TaxID=1131835 RepID=UPI0026312C6F|nr:tetratricopeptide repeat protein [uncultured Piscinibacter sp.]